MSCFAPQLPELPAPDGAHQYRLVVPRLPNLADAS